MKRLAVALAAVCLAPSLAGAQAPRGMTNACPAELNRILTASAGKDSVELRQFLTFSAGMDCMTTLLLTQASGGEVLLDRAEAVRAALQQNGASSGGGNSTSLVSKGVTAQVLSIASEYGALTESTSGQTVTVAGSLGGIPVALTKNGVLSNCAGINVPGSLCVSNKTVNALNRFSYSVSFNASSTSQAVTATTASGSSPAQPATFAPSPNTISAATAKLVIIPGAAASISDTVTAINKLTPTSSISNVPAAEMSTAKADFQFFADLDSKPPMHDPSTGWTAVTAAKIVAAGPGNWVNAWLAQAPALMDAVCPQGANSACRSDALKKLAEYALFVNGYKSGVNAFVENLRKSPLLTFEYDLNQPANQPSNSTFRLVGQSVLGGWTWTFNGAGSIYNSEPSSSIPGASQLRDVQVAAEASYDFSKAKKSTLLGHSTGSVAFYYQDQTSPAIVNITPGTITGLPPTATQVFAQKGPIDIAQAKFTFSPGTSGIKLPISVTWANRTELVTNSLWRGQVGISYNFDSLLSALK